MVKVNIKRGKKPRKYCQKAGHLMSETREFRENGKSFCGLCFREYHKKYNKKRALSHDERRRYYRKFLLKSKYGLTIDGYKNLLIIQDNKCGICNINFSKKVVPVIDHCHDSGKVRGLLCHSCNKGIGFLKDNKKILRSAIVYLSNI